MALTRNKIKEILSTAGVDGDHMDAAVQAIIDGHTATVDSLKEERDTYKKAADELPGVKAELETLKEKSKGGDPYKEKYEKEHNDFEAYKAAQTEKETAGKKKEAYKALLKENKVSDDWIDTILQATDLKDAKLDKDGKLEDADKLSDTIKSKWSKCIVTEGAKGASTTNPPAGKGGGSMSKDDIMKIKDAGERQQAIAENHELFGF